MESKEFTILYEMTKDIKTSVEGLNAKIDQAIIENAKQDGRLTALEDRVKERNNFINIVLAAFLTGLVTLFVEGFQVDELSSQTKVGLTHQSNPLKQVPSPFI